MDGEGEEVRYGDEVRIAFTPGVVESVVRCVFVGVVQEVSMR